MIPSIGTAEAQSQLMTQGLKDLEKQKEHLGKNQANFAKIRKAAKQFEGFMTSFMFKEMYNSIPKSEAFGSRDAQNIFMGLYMDEITKKVDLGANGIANQMINRYAEQYGIDPSLIKEIDQTKENPTLKLSNKLTSMVDQFRHRRSMDKISKDFDSAINKMAKNISSDFGMREHPIYKKQKMHDGIDVALAQGTKVKLPSPGQVVFAGDKGGYGNTVVIDHGHGVTSMYAHLSKIDVKPGQKVRKNGLLGLVGSTGVSTGPHLHFEVRKNGNPIDPRNLGKPGN